MSPFKEAFRGHLIQSEYSWLLSFMSTHLLPSQHLPKFEINFIYLHAKFYGDSSILFGNQNNTRHMVGGQVYISTEIIYSYMRKEELYFHFNS